MGALSSSLFPSAELDLSFGGTPLPELEAWKNLPELQRHWAADTGSDR